jgi:translation initiation factor IF-2
MRARGAKVTDIAVIIIAADDAVMPRHGSDQPRTSGRSAPLYSPSIRLTGRVQMLKIKEELSRMNLLVEDWGGKSSLLIFLQKLEKM